MTLHHTTYPTSQGLLTVKIWLAEQPPYGPAWWDSNIRNDKLQALVVIQVLQKLLPLPLTPMGSKGSLDEIVTDHLRLMFEGATFVVYLSFEPVLPISADDRHTLAQHLNRLSEIIQLPETAAAPASSISTEEQQGWSPEYGDDITLLHVPEEDPDVIRRALVSAAGNHDTPLWGHTHGGTTYGMDRYRY